MTICKWKACLCAHGWQQELGLNYWETYALVMSWSTVWLVLILSLIAILCSHQVDYVQAYLQADIDCDIYMEVLAGFHIINDSLTRDRMAARNTNSWDYILKLCKNLYGLKQARHNWFQKLCQGLLDCGFMQSKIDPCLFWCNGIFLVMCIDDCLNFAKTNNIIDTLIESLQMEFTLMDEGDINGFSE